MDSETGYVIIEKPLSVSFDQIHEVLWAANESNRNKGIILKTSELNGPELEERIGRDGKCFVAMKEDRVIGTASMRVRDRDRWYYKGRIAELILVAVIPECQGKGLVTLLMDKVLDTARKRGFSAIETDTAEKNARAIDIYKHRGFQPVDYRRFIGADHFSVVMVKWLNACPYSETKRKWNYAYRRAAVRVKYRMKAALRHWYSK